VIRKSLTPGLEDIVFGRFRKAGLRIISPINALTGVFDALEKNDVVIFIMDQHAVLGSKAIAVEFFGREAGTNRSLALVARQSGAPVIPAFVNRTAVTSCSSTRHWSGSPPTIPGRRSIATPSATTKCSRDSFWTIPISGCGFIDGGRSKYGP
jgi:KDO2-lipid IV(A) lauroyltransferase